jgi:sugar/nucleoside kinase (ribokinase family)
LLTGAPDPVAALGVLTGRFRRAGVLIRLGPAGCLLGRRGSVPRRLAGYRVRAVDTNGAGDTHTGCFLAALASGAAEADAARRANAAAALSVTRRGPATAPTTEELGRFLAGHRAGGERGAGRRP